MLVIWLLILPVAFYVDSYSGTGNLIFMALYYPFLIRMDLLVVRYVKHHKENR